MREPTLQILRYIALPCVLSCMALNADDYSSDTQTGGKEPFKSTYERIEMKEITPNAGTAVQGGVDAYVEADYILWHVNEAGLAYANRSSGLNVDGSKIFGKVMTPNFKTNSGFKVGLGLDFNYDGWDLGATYTWLHSHASSSIQNSAANYTGLVTLGTLGAASGDWRLHFNNIDLELGRNFFVSPKLALRPHFGLKGTWQTQKFLTTINSSQAIPIYDSESETTSYVNTQQITRGTNQQYYWGLGVRTGLDTSWMITRCFSFFGDWAFSALWGQFTASQKGVVNQDYDPGTANIIGYNVLVDNLYNRTHQLNGVLELQLGFRYDYWFCEDDYRFRVQAGWENQLWFNQNQLLLLNNINQVNTDLSFQGFTLNFRLDF